LNKPAAFGEDDDAAPQRLRLISYNIQTGVDTRHYRQYLTHSWKHVLPHRERLANLNRIAVLLARYDLVGLQEVDSGSLRSGFVDQTEYLAHRAGFPHWYKQINRSLGKFAQHSNGVLTRLRPSAVEEHKLPGLPGRGAILVEFGRGGQGLAVCVLHLALGRRAQGRQLGYIGELVADYPNLVLMGDLNCECDAEALQRLIRRVGLCEPSCELKTFPSWRPMRNLDHILVSPSLGVPHTRVLDYPFSDHLPIEVEVQLPAGVRIAA
jgi:endonuclease/exonuclease/phosphatase family metal-dependent hydrolase